MTGPVSDTVALVTGASSGIGAATALALAREGAAVALVARRRDRLADIAEGIRATGGAALAVEADITDQTQAASAVEQVVAEFGRLDTLVNNAGLMLVGPVEGAPLDEWDRMISVNLQGLLYMSRAALPHLLRAAEGPRATADLVNVSSIAGRLAPERMGVYSMTKHGVGAFSDSLRKEVSERHVRVSLVEPGVVATELFSHNRPGVIEAGGNPFGEKAQLLLPDDVAQAIAFIVTRPARVVVSELVVRPDASL